jgi:hypothetical protein
MFDCVFVVKEEEYYRASIVEGRGPSQAMNPFMLYKGGSTPQMGPLNDSTN